MMRRATPDSEAVVSSEDEKPWPSATTFGSLPRKENGVPGLGGGIWASQSRGSFKLSDQARRIAARETRLGAPNPTHPSARSANTPSPAASSEGTNTLPFAIPLQPTPKAGRSLSHSQGQREMPFPSAPSVQSQQAGGGMVPMGLLNEAEEGDDDTEDEYDYGSSSLTQLSSQPPLAALQRTVTMPSQYESYGHSNRSDRRAETMDEQMFQQKLDRRFEAALGGLTVDQPPRRPQWQTSLGWEELPNINESRRHSLADIPTRRGSLVGIDHDPRIPAAYNGNNDNLHPPLSSHSDINNNNTRNIDQYTIPEGYRVPYVALEPHERADQRNMLSTMSSARPRKLLYVVSFKCSRVGVFYLLDNTGLVINEGDMVIVEADRGQDLGTVQHARVTQEEAKTLLSKYGEEQYKWLMMFSRNNQAGAVNPNATVYGDVSNTHTFSGGNPLPPTSNNLSTRPPRDQYQTLKPKAIKRMAAQHEINMLKEKEGNEAKAKRACQQRVYQHHLDMEILEAEFQWDWQKLIFYYYADHYVNFKDLVNDLYKCYKVRLWMSAVNPASFSHNAVGQPPTGIGPGAVGSPNVSEFDQSYTMQYGTDPDPYGAVPTYRIHDIYNPGVPGPVGVPNDYSQPQPQQQPQQLTGPDVHQQQSAGGAAQDQQYSGNTAQARFFQGYQLDDRFMGPPGSHQNPYRGGAWNNRPGEARIVDRHALYEDMYGPGPFVMGGPIGGVGMGRQYRGMADHRQWAAHDAAEYTVRKAEERRQASRNAAAGGQDPISNSYVGIITNPAQPGNATYQNQQAAQQLYAATHNNNGTPSNAQQPQQQQQQNGPSSGNGNGTGNSKAPAFDNNVVGIAPRGTPDNRHDRYDLEYVATPNFRFPQTPSPSYPSQASSTYDSQVAPLNTNTQQPTGRDETDAGTDDEHTAQYDRIDYHWFKVGNDSWICYHRWENMLALL